MDPKAVTDRIIEVIKNFEKVRCSPSFVSLHACALGSVTNESVLQVDAKKVSAAARFKEDLDLDSLDAVEVVMAIEEEFCIEIPDSEADKILSIPDAVAYISGHPMAK